MTLFTRTIWPPSVRFPYGRLCLALLVAPLLMAGALTVLAFLLAGTSEQDGNSVATVTGDAAIAFLILSFAFTFTFGLTAIMALWAMKQAGPLAWTIAGILAGALGGLMFSKFFIGGVERPILLSFMLGAAILLYVIRLIAGIQDDETA